MKKIDWGQASVDALRRATILSRMQKLEFAEKRGVDMETLVVEETKDGFFISDGTYKYLIIRPEHPNHAQALAQLDQSTRNYHLTDGTVLLEKKY